MNHFILMIILLVLFIVIMFLTIFLLISYNSFTKLNIFKGESLENINTLYKKRWSLLPTFISAVRNTTNDFPEELEQLIKIKNNLYDKKTEDEKQHLNNQLNTLLSKLLPELKNIYEFSSNKKNSKDTEKFIQINTEIKEAIMEYQNFIKNYKNKVKRFPYSVIAKFTKY